MSSDSPNLSSLARSKLHLSGGSKDKCSLHRWVLLKNSFVRSIPLTANASTPPDRTDGDYSETLASEVEEEENPEDADSFMFPDVEKFVDRPGADGNASEAQWLDSLLEALGDDDNDDDDFTVDSGSTLQNEEDDDQVLSPLPSPMSSSDDLTSHSYFASPISYPYLVPYPPLFHPPVVHSYPFEPSFNNSSDNALPYCVLDDVADLPVPDAIEDTSDDESDTPLTPSIQSSSSLTLPDPATIPLPADRSRLGRISPHIYIDSDDSSFYPYELDLDPLPFSNDFRVSYNLYQEC